MKASVVLICVVFLASCGSSETRSAPLVEVDSADYGDTKHQMRIVETERHENTSKLRLTYEKMAGSVGSSMFIMFGVCEVAKSRGFEYFVNLKEWGGQDGERVYIVGFTNDKDVGIHDEFGKEFTLTNEQGQNRRYMSVSDCELLRRGQSEGTSNKRIKVDNQ